MSYSQHRSSEENPSSEKENFPHSDVAHTDVARATDAPQEETVDQHPAQTLPHGAGPLSHFVSSEAAAAWFVEVEDYAMFLCDLDGRIVSWNQGVERILQFQESEFIGQSVAIIFTPEDVAQEAHLHEMQTALKEGRAIDERWHLRKDGSCFWASGILTLLKDEEDRPCGFAKIMRDKTQDKLWEEERERLLREANEARAQAEKVNARKDHFIAVVSHEMRTPLSTICGWLSLMQMQTLDEETTRSALETLRRNADSLVFLVNDLLDIEQLRSGRFQLKPEPVKLLPIVASVLEEMKPQAQNKDIQLQTKIESQDDLIEGDKARLEQILRNLLSNAIKFTPEGQKVTVGLARAENEIALCVTDTGRGIPSEYLQRIFEEFRQVDESDNREHGGLGLGLAIVEKLVKLHGGTIHVESAGANQGTTFRLHFPLSE